MDTILTVEGLSRSFVRRKGKSETRLWALRDISFELQRQEVLTIIGPSGCGKSTLLDCVAGLASFDSGTVTIDGSPVDGPSRACSMVFQQASLLPWRTVGRNVSYSLEMQRGLPSSEHEQLVDRVLKLVGLMKFKDHYPHELSGGMQQRVNLARALVTEPQLLLMDEPFGALDALTKEVLQDELVALTARSHVTTVFITHDIEEAVFLGNRVLVLDGSPGQIVDVVAVPFPHPRSREVTEHVEFQVLVRRLRDLLRPATESWKQVTSNP